MSSQQLSKLNFLSSTQRRFYKRKKPSHDLFTNDPNISKVVKVLNTSSSIRKINKFQLLKTESNQQRFSQDYSKTCQYKTFNQPQFIKRQLKAKLQMLFKKSSKKWKGLLQSYQDLKSCSNIESFNIQENKFLINLTELVKTSIEETGRFQTVEKTMKGQFSSVGKRQQNALRINLQKIKLMKENQTLRKKCIQSTLRGYNHNGQQSISQETTFPKQTPSTSNNKLASLQELETSLRLKQQLKDLNQQKYQLQNQNIQLKESLATAQDALNLIKQDRQDLSKKVAQLKLQNQNFCSQFVRINLENQNTGMKMQRWRSIIAFQREEILSYESELISIKTQYKDLMRKYKILVKRLNGITTTTSNSFSNSIGFDSKRQGQQFKSRYIQSFKQQLQSFQKIRMTFYNKESQCTLEKSSTYTQKKTSNTSSTSDSYKNYLSEKETLSNPNGVKKLSREYYVYFKPNFYNFVESYMDVNGIDPTTMEQVGVEFQLDAQFLATIRAILDSKFNDFLNQNFSKSSSLPNFTYAWLSKYKVQRKQKKIVSIKGDLEKDVIPKFFMNLMSERLNCNWEIITFRQFLMESLTLDELYFYLMARHFIFQGSVLDNISVVYQQICYVSIADGLNLMQKFISDVSYRRKIQQYIKKYIIYVRKRPLIDAHFLLRILVEYYQAKKHQQLANLSSLTQLLSKDKVSSFSFDSFMKIFQYNFGYLSMTERLEIYKKSFSCSRGKINLESILTVLSQEGYLCREVKKVFCNDQIVLSKDQSRNKDQDSTFEAHLPEFQNFEKFFEKFYKQSYETQKASFGLQQVERKFSSVKQFDQTLIFQRIELVFGFCLSSLKKSFFSKKITLSNFLPIMQEIVDTLQTFNRFTCTKKATMSLITQFKRDSAAKKILRFYRKKRNQMHRNFILGVKDDFAEEEQKMSNIRKEFSSLISNLKDKFTKKNQIPKQQIKQL